MYNIIQKILHKILYFRIYIFAYYVHPVQGGKKSLFVAIINGFYTFDLIEIHVKNLPQN